MSDELQPEGVERNMKPALATLVQEAVCLALIDSAVPHDEDGKERFWTDEERQAMEHDIFAMPGEALVVSMIFYRPRPKSHLRTNGEVRPSAPRDPITRPDVLKLARLCEDALTGIVYHDDSCIVSEHLYKCYGEPARVYVSIDTAANAKPIHSSLRAAVA